MRNGIEIIDFRARPPSVEFRGYFKPDHVGFFARRHGILKLAPSYHQGSVGMFFEEADRAGVDKMVVANRMVPAVKGSPPCDIPNEHVADLVRAYPDRLVGIAGIDVGGGFGDPVAAARHAVTELGMRGIHISPGRSALYTQPDDRRLYPLYELCAELRVPVLIMTGPHSGESLQDTNPLHIQKAATDFPGVDFIAGHACWPYVRELIAVAYRHQNVYIAPDSYLYLPGGDELVLAVNSFLEDQYLYSSSYPVGELDTALERFLAMPFEDRVLPKILSGNARRVLRLAAQG